jgi:hypothetical protein
MSEATVTLSLREFDRMREDIKDLEAETKRWRDAIVTVYGDEAANKLLEQAGRIIMQRAKSDVYERAIKGKL